MKSEFRHYFLSFLILVPAFACSPKLSTDAVLRVGSTGDYPPLTIFDTLTHQFHGEDIELALRLGKHLSKKVIFVKTTWKDLSADLLDRKFDIAAGGISVNETRAKLFNFSIPLLMDRKVAIFRLADHSKFIDFKAIDQPGVRILENKGGTNEIFAEKTIQRAAIKIIADNQQVFKALLNKDADVMFTDETEARYQQKKHPELYWIKLEEQLSPAYAKAMMYNKADTVLQRKVDEWLKRQNK